MTNRDQGLRKAAILIDMLDPANADALLERIADESADRVRRASLQLEPVEPVERRQILDELHGCRPAACCNRQTDADGDETSESQVSLRGAADMHARPGAAGGTKRDQPPEGQILDPLDRSAKTVDSAATSSDPQPFGFLNDTPIDVLSSYFAGEHPQAVSIVLAHLSPQRAAEYLATLPGQRRADVLRRLARLEATDADVINDVERGLQTVLADRARSVEERPLGLATLEAILNAVDDDRRREFLGHLRSAAGAPLDDNGGGLQPSRPAASVDRVLHTRVPANELPRRVGNLLDALAAPARSPDGSDRAASARGSIQGAETVLEFEDFADLDDAALARVFRSADPQVALLALCGAGRDLVDRILGRLPLREARVLRRQIEQLGPTRLRDIESAQRRLAELARQMAEEGQIKVPSNRRFTVAA